MVDYILDIQEELIYYINQNKFRHKSIQNYNYIDNKLFKIYNIVRGIVMKHYWIVINKSGIRSIVFDFETAREYTDKGFKVIYVAEDE